MHMMDSRIGLDFIVENPEYIGKLAAALVTNTTIVKKQVFELLSALCVYNEEGHARALDTLDHYKKLKGERYRLSVIVGELDRATAVDYQTAIVAFINCLIISTPRLADRIRLRNEFIGCHLLPVLNHLRKSAEAEPELAIQLDVFDEQREADDAQSMQGPHGVDLNSPLDVFYAILRQVAETPQEIPFLSILQHLLRIDSKEAVSDIIWDTAERLVHRATLLENRDDAARLLRAPSVQAKLFCHCQHRSESSPSRKQSLNTSPTSSVATPPIPPPMMLPPPPPPPPPQEKSTTNIPPPAPIPPPPLLKSAMPVSQTTELDVVIEKLPQQEIPQPKIKMKTINWNKIPSNKVVGKNNIWSLVACSHQHSPMADMDWSEIEGLFCQQFPPTASTNSSPKLGGRDVAEGTLERRVRKDTSEITLLDGKRSLNVNIFLKQFRSTNEDIVELIREGAHDDIGAEKLKGLLKILPEVDELDMLKSFNGDYTKLGNAEKFLLQLTNLSNYKLRIEGMLLKEEFASNMSYLEPSINSMIVASEDLMTNKPLQEVLYMILIAGNFLNSGGYAGNAAGVKLSSLQKITDIRANKPNMNLIHYVALQAEKKNKNLTTFVDNVSALEEASKNTVEQLNNEINALDVRIKKVKKQIELPSTEMEIKQQMTEFLQMAEREVSNLQKDMVVLENVRKSLSDFFCEDANSFKLEECFRIFHSFYVKFRQAVAENARRRLQEEQASARRRQREELLASRRRQMGSLAGTPVSDSDFDAQIYDPRTGFPGKKQVRKPNGSYITSEDEISIAGSPAVTRRRLGSFNGQGGDNSITGREEKSPDITPNGSLRRRRSRVLTEEDEGNLMEFLRASGGNDTNRERKSWGSLDRSWARRARGSGPRKRPALLGTEFSEDRERPSSPSPLAETKPLLPTTEEECKQPKEWRQKIESWLQANESDQITEEARKQTRRLTNRRSLEVDSESERSSTLDPLPEGKQVHSGQSTYHRVYPDWKPSTTIDKTDVMGAMEAVEDAQPQVKDKSAWRKSNLNVANSTEETKPDNTRQRHTLPRTTYIDKSLPTALTGAGVAVPSSGGVIDEEQNRKVLISSLGERPASDKLTVYIRRPSDDITDKGTSKLGYVPKRLHDNHSLDQGISNKIEIDSDNIETPPATRRVFTPTPVDKREPLQPSPCRRLQGRNNRDVPSPDEPDPPTSLGDGQFDRFSATRRTRRYKRSTEHSSGDVTMSPELVAETHIIKPTTLQLETSTPVDIEPLDLDKETRLKAWQERLNKNQDVPDVKMTTLRVRGRNQTGISKEDVRKALNNKTTSPVNIGKPISRDDSMNNKKTKEHDNDEGFEETQSLMSESPSQGASSAGNYDADIVDTSNLVINDYSKSKPQRASSLESKGTVDSTTSSESPPNPTATTTTTKRLSNLRISPRLSNITSKTQSLVQRFNRSAPLVLDRNNPTRHTIQDVVKKSVIPRRSGSLRKTDSSSTITPTNRRLDVERSNSRNSLVSSRSSLNSATSTSTVKKVPSKNNISNIKPLQRIPSSKTTMVKATTGVKRIPSNSGLAGTTQRPPRPTSLSFMKPTTASSTKINSPSVIPSRVQTSFRTK